MMIGRLTVGRLMLAIAAVAAVLAAGMYRWQNSDVDRAATSAGLRTLRRGDADARRRAAIELGENQAAEPAAVLAGLAEAAAGDADAGVRAAAVATIRAVLIRALTRPAAGPPPTGPPPAPTDADLVVTRTLLRALGDVDPAVRREAAGVAPMAAEAGRATPELVAAIGVRLLRLLDDGDPAVRARAIEALGAIRPAPAEARGRALALMGHDPDAAVRKAAVQALVTGWPAPELYPILLARRAVAPTPGERGWILRMLVSYNVPIPTGSIPALAELLDTDPSAARWVPRALGKLGAAARPWIGAVGRVAEQELRRRETVDDTTILALVQIDPGSPEAQAALEPIARFFGDATDEAERARFTWLLDRYAHWGVGAMPRLREALHSPTAGVRGDAARLLGGLGPAGGPALADLDAVYQQDPDPAVRALARVALQKLRAASD